MLNQDVYQEVLCFFTATVRDTTYNIGFLLPEIVGDKRGIHLYQLAEIEVFDQVIGDDLHEPADVLWLCKEPPHAPVRELSDRDIEKIKCFCIHTRCYDDLRK